MYFKKALSIALKNRSDLKYEGDGSFDDVVKFLKDNDVTFTDPDGETIKLAKGITISVSKNDGPADEVTVEDGSAPDDMEGEAMDGEDDEDEGEKSRSRSRQPLPRGKHKTADLLRAGSSRGGINSPEGLKRLALRKAYDRKVDARFSSSDESEMFAAFMRQRIAKDTGRDYEGARFDADICKKAGLSTQNALGGALVPEIFEPTLIKLREEYGTAPRLIPITEMASAVEIRPRRTSGITVTAHSEGAAITESSPNYDSIELVAKEWAALTYLPISLLNSAAIDLDSEVVDEMSYAFAEKLDDVVFNGDGTSTYFGITGLRAKLKAVSGTIANIQGLEVGSGNAYSEITLTDFQGVESRLPAYAEARSDGWVIHKRTFGKTAAELALAAGGVTANEVTNYSGVGTRRFLGAPVNFVQNMPSTEANSQVFALYGDFSEAAKIGRVRGSLAMAADGSYRFGNGQIAYRMLDQIAVNVHDVGDTTEAGPVVGLITAAS